MKKILFVCMIASLGLGAFAAPRPADKPFAWATRLKYPFLPKRKMTFVDGVVKNKDACALPDVPAAQRDKRRAVFMIHAC